MKMFKAQTRLVSLLGLLVFLWSTASAQVTPLGDSYTNTADPATNFGAGAVLHVGATQIAYIQFNLESIPATASISQATLNFYVNAVSTPGSFNVDYVNGAWVENTIDATNAPPAGAGNHGIASVAIRQVISMAVCVGFRRFSIEVGGRPHSPEAITAP